MDHLSVNEIYKRLEELNHWEMIDDGISKRFEFPDFKAAMEFVNRVAVEAENENHHPDIAINYNKVILHLVTHSVGGLTHKDFKLAKIIDNL